MLFRSCKTVIAKGAPTKANTGAAHGAPLGDKEIEATRAAIGWPHAPFTIPPSVYAGWDAKSTGAALEKKWARTARKFAKAHPAEFAEFERRMKGDLPASWQAHCDAVMSQTVAKSETIATRKASQNAIEMLAPVLPELVGGSAD